MRQPLQIYSVLRMQNMSKSKEDMCYVKTTFCFMFLGRMTTTGRTRTDGQRTDDDEGTAGRPGGQMTTRATTEHDGTDGQRIDDDGTDVRTTTTTDSNI